MLEVSEGAVNWRRLFRDPALRLAVFTLWGMAGFVLTVAAYLDWNLGALAGLLAFGDEQKAAALLLFLMVGVEGVLWAIGALLLLEWYAEVLSDPRPRAGELVVGWLVPTGVFLVMAGYFQRLFLTGSIWPPGELAGVPISKGLGLLVFLVAAASVAGLFATALRVRLDLKQCDTSPARSGAARPPMSPEDLSECVRAYLRLKGYQDRFLALAGAIFGASVVTAMLLTRAYNTTCGLNPGDGHEPFSYTYAFVHAGFYSLGLAVAFLVARQPILSVGQALFARLTEAPPGVARDLSQWVAAEREARTLLQLRAYSVPALAEATSILAPLIGAVVPALLGGT